MAVVLVLSLLAFGWILVPAAVPIGATAVLVAGMPRRVADFAGGAQERLLDQFGAGADRLLRATQEYRTAATGLLLAHPWRTRLRLRRRIAALRG